MSFRSKILSLVDVILRVPPLFIIDELFRIGLGLSQVEDQNSKESGFIAGTDEARTHYNESIPPDSYDRDVLPYKFLFITFVKVISSLLGKYINNLIMFT